MLYHGNFATFRVVFPIIHRSRDQGEGVIDPLPAQTGAEVDRSVAGVVVDKHFSDRHILTRSYFWALSHGIYIKFIGAGSISDVTSEVKPDKWRVLHHSFFLTAVIFGSKSAKFCIKHIRHKSSLTLHSLTPILTSSTITSEVDWRSLHALHKASNQASTPPLPSTAYYTVRGSSEIPPFALWKMRCTCSSVIPLVSFRQHDANSI